MSIALLVYLYLVVGKLLNQACIISVIYIVCSSLVVFGHYIHGYDTEVVKRMFNRYIVRTAFLFLIPVFVLNSLYPSKTDLGIIIGAGALYSVSQTEEAKRIPNNVLKAVNTLLEDISND